MIDLISNNAVSFVTIVIFVFVVVAAHLGYREGHKRGQVELRQVQARVELARGLKKRDAEERAPMEDAYALGFSALHLRYEIDMLASLGQRALPLLRGQPIAQFEKNVLVESYAIHLRSLIEFLYSDPRGTDVGAADYVRDEAAWKVERGPRPAVLAEARERTGKQIAHLTRQRFEDEAEEKSWHPEIEIPALAAPLKVFAAHADPQRLYSGVTQVIDKLAEIRIAGE